HDTTPSTHRHDSFSLYFPPHRSHRHLHSFPTRRSSDLRIVSEACGVVHRSRHPANRPHAWTPERPGRHARVDRRSSPRPPHAHTSEEHTSELQSRGPVVCRLAVEKKKRDEEHEREGPGV